MSSALITKETATEIAFAYREVENAEKLLEQITKALGERDQPDIRDAFGRQQGGLQLGVPTGHSSHQLFNVPWKLAQPIIETHIATQRAKIAALTQKAFAELSGGGEARS